MTAEIAIMNREAVALAADSAITTQRGKDQKIFTSGNKLFALSKYHPVGIMVYGNSVLNNVPWETIVKIYRKNFGKKKFDKLEEYARDFIAFLDNGNPLFPKSCQDRIAYETITDYFFFVFNKINKEVKDAINKQGQVDDKSIKSIISRVIGQQFETWDKTNNIPSIPKTYNKKRIGK
jgi:hypothetical protein